MKELELSKRLQGVADYIEEGARVADIGSDHAYLPCYLAEQNILTFGVAGEIAKGPYENTLREVKERQLNDRIEVRFGDGLSVLSDEDQINTLTICGMGGILISQILKEGRQNNKINGSETLILQANNNENTLREYLMKNNYKITDEAVVVENRKYYEIIKAVPSKQIIDYTEKELFFGPQLLKNQPETFRLKWETVHQRKQKIIAQMEKSNTSDLKKLDEIRDQVKLIEEVLL